MTRGRIAGLLSVWCSLFITSSATTVYLPAGPPFETKIVSPGCTNTTPTVCTVVDASLLAVDDVVSISGVASNALNHMSSVRGLLKIKAVSGNLITLKTMAGADLAANGTWENGDDLTQGWPAGIQSVRKMTAFTTVEGPKGVFDGWNGPVTRSWSLGTHNGLTSLTVASNVATVTYSYPHGLATGNKVTVWNTTNSTFTPTGGREFAITSTGANTYTFPVTVANGNYTHNDACGPGATPNGTVQGTDNCVRISSRATSANPYWVSIQAFTAPPTALPFDGRGAEQTQYGVFTALRFFVDLKAQAYLDYSLKFLKQLEMLGGNNFPASTVAADGGNYTLSAQVSNQMMNVGEVYSIVGAYLSPTQRQTFLDKAINDISDPVPCTKVLPAPIAVNTGTATAADVTHITLGSGASGTNGFYVNNTVEAVTAGIHSVGLITAYNGTTKQATVTGWDNGVPSSSATYSVWETFSASSSTRNTSVTLTGYNTHWNSPGADQLHVGDFLFSVSHWNVFLDPAGTGGVVTSITDDTHVTVFSGYFGISTTPATGWITYPWTTGNCGLQWLQNLWVATFGSQPSQYPPRGGSVSGTVLGSNITGNLAAYEIPFYLAVVDDDPRAVTNLARFAVMGIDENTGLNMSYMSMFYAGESYGPGRATQGAYGIAWPLWNSVVGYPSLDLSGPWVTGFQQWKQYGLHPDTYTYPYSGNSFGLSPLNYTMAMDYGIAFDPTTPASKYTKYLLDNVLHFNTSSGVGNTGLSDLAVRLDPNAPSLDYKAQPLQYLFTATSRNAALTFGWTKPATWRGDAFISRTGWTHTFDTHLWYGARTFVGDHDAQVQPGDLQVYKAGFFLANDNLPPGDLNESGSGPYLEFGGAPTYRAGDYQLNGPAIVNITRWAGSPPYGDTNSNYAYALSDMTGAYTTPLNRAQRHVVHFKKPGTEEIIVTFADVSSPSLRTIRDQLFYVQNGETPVGGDARLVYPEGTTTYPGSGGCGALNTNRTVLSQQDGLSTGGPVPLPGTTAPLRKYNMISKFLSPGTITVNCDGTSYSGATGHAQRVSIYGGAGVGGTSTSLESLAIHKITTQPDTTLTATPLNPDPNWTGVQTADKVVLFARGGITYSTLIGLTTTHAGTAQYLAAGLTSGYYDVYNGATRIVSGAAVADADNTLTFENVSGTYTITALGSVTITTAAPLAPGLVGTAYAQTFAQAGGTSPFTWSITSGALPAGLSLSSSGILSGTPGTPGTSNFTVHVVDNLGVGDSKAFSIIVYGALAIPTTSALPFGAPNVPYSQTISATGGDGNYNWTLAAGALPGGLSLSPVGIISGTPAGGETQVFTLHITSGDGQALNKQFSITIAVPVGVTTGSPLPASRVGTPYSQTFSGTGGTSPYTWSVISGALPDGLSLSSGGTISGIPSSTGDSTFTVQAMDTLGATASKQFSMTIFGTISIITTSPLQDGLVGTSYSQNLAAVGGDANYTWSVLSGTLPTGLTLASNGVITGTPTLPGVNSATIQVLSGDSQTASVAFSITVLSPPAAAKAGSAVRAGAVVH